MSIYLDHHATTPLDPQVRQVWLDHLHLANPASRHAPGRRAAAALERARQGLARACGVQAEEVVFTSGATEADRLALRPPPPGSPPAHLVVSAIEHRAVLDQIRAWRQAGHQASVVPVRSDGRIRVAELLDHVRPHTACVSIGLVNNEIGVVQDLAAITRALDDHPTLVHTDAAQALGRVPVDVGDLGVHLMTLSAHKAGGPRGVGALVGPGLSKLARQAGASTVHGLRPGTPDVAGAVAFAEAARLARTRQPADERHCRRLRERLLQRLGAAGVQLELNGSLEHRVAGNLSLLLPGVEAETLLATVADRLAISAGSACHADSPEPSHVLLALGRSPLEALCSVRIGLWRTTTPAEVDEAARILATAIGQVFPHALAPCYSTPCAPGPA